MGENERAALKRCLAAIDGALDGYPTTAEEDEQLLPSLSGFSLHLVQLRHDEKIVLKWWRRFFSVALESLHLTVDEIEARAEKEFGRFSHESKYLRIQLAALVAVEAKHGTK